MPAPTSRASGSIGHASEIAKASEVTVTIEAGQVPVFNGVLALASANRSGGLGSNEEHFAGQVTVEPGVDPDRADDPVRPANIWRSVSCGRRSDAADRVRTALIAAGVAAVRIGSIGRRDAGTHIVVRP